jgi:hypothetical protein
MLGVRVHVPVYKWHDNPVPGLPRGRKQRGSLLQTHREEAKEEDLEERARQGRGRICGQSDSQDELVDTGIHSESRGSGFRTGSKDSGPDPVVVPGVVSPAKGRHAF